MQIEELFVTILNMSVTASYVIAAAVVLRLLLKRAPKWITSVLWGIAAVRLIFPFSMQSVLSVFSVLPSADTVTPDILYSAAPTIHTGIPAVNSTVNPALSESMATTGGTSVLQTAAHIGSIIWLAGMALLLVYSIAAYIRLKRRTMTATRLCANVYQSDSVASPFLLGLIRPKIYVPYSLGGPELSHVIRHENAHIARRDYLLKPLAFVILALHWFNPLVWAAYLLFCRDTELACDEKVIRGMTTAERKSYSAALLGLAVRRSRIAACPLAFGEVSVRDRVKKALSYKKPAFWIIVAALAACAVAAICLLSDPVSDVSEDERVTISVRIACDTPVYVVDYKSELASYSYESEGGFEKGDVINIDVLVTDDENYSLSAFGEDGKVIANTAVFDDLTVPKTIVFAVTDDGIVRVGETGASGTVAVHDIADLYGAYQSTEVVYVNPVMSYYPLEDDPIYYTFAEDAFTIVTPDSEEVTTYDAPQYAYTALTNSAFSDLFSPSVGVPDVSADESIERITVTEKYSLFIAGSELWLADIDNGQVQVMVRLEPSVPYTVPLTIDALEGLVDTQGPALSWRDLEAYEHVETGSGLYIWQLPVDEDFCVLIGGGGPDADPMYVKLIRLSADGEMTDEFLDLLDKNADVQRFVTQSRLLQ